MKGSQTTLKIPPGGDGNSSQPKASSQRIKAKGAFTFVFTANQWK
jgi:hypothetical protein